MLANYHTHTYRCKHAIGTVDDYVNAAVKRGLTTLGFSDHSPMPDERWAPVRMALDELDEYLAEIDRAQQRFPTIRLLKGLECEFADDLANFIADELLGARRLDYLVAGPHWVPIQGEWLSVYRDINSPAHLSSYVDYLAATMSSGLFAFIAHPDLFATSYLRWDDNTRAAARDICAASIQLKVPLELNAYGMRKPKIATPDGDRWMYPWRPFWEIAADLGVSVVVSSDAHAPEDVADFAAALSLAKSCGINAPAEPALSRSNQS